MTYRLTDVDMTLTWNCGRRSQDGTTALFRIAHEAQKRLAQWLSEPCPHTYSSLPPYIARKRYECLDCMAELLKDFGLEK